MKITSILLTTLALFATAATAQDAALLAAERARGVMTGNTGVQWIVNVKTTGTENKTASFSAISQNGKIVAEVLTPEDAKGRKYLAESDGDMWFFKPGLSRPVSVSRRQRLNGDAAIGDIASTSFVDGYKVAGQSDGEVNGEAATVYSLKANSLGDTYAEIKYWVTKKGNLGKKAEFYTRGGKLLRTSMMEYGNTANGGPFLSRMLIQDSGRNIDLKFSDVKIGSYPASLFERDNLGGSKGSGNRR